jgi:hypothetical protein
VISVKLMIYCLVAGALYLLIITALLELLAGKLGINKSIPPELLEPLGASWLALTYLMELLFFVIIPTLAYSFFYLIFPLTGPRAGVAGALFAFTLGAVPALMGLSVRVKISMLYLLYFLLSLLLKLGGAMTIIGYLYSL